MLNISTIETSPKSVLSPWLKWCKHKHLFCVHQCQNWRTLLMTILCHSDSIVNAIEDWTMRGQIKNGKTDQNKTLCGCLWYWYPLGACQVSSARDLNVVKTKYSFIFIPHDTPALCCVVLHRFHNQFSQSRRKPLLCTRAFSWLKAPTRAFTFKTLLRHYAKRALTPR